VFALFEDLDGYFRPVKGFLNEYLEDNRDRSTEDSEELAKLFRSSSHHIHEGIGPRAFKPVRALNAAVLDSVMVGVMRRLQSGEIRNHGQLKQAYDTLMGNTEYRAATTYSTAAEESVAERIQLATNAFASVE
jgi:hypothetical protein